MEAHSYIGQRYPDMVKQWKLDYQKLIKPDFTEEDYLQDKMEDAWLMIQVIRKRVSQER